MKKQSNETRTRRPAVVELNEKQLSQVVGGLGDDVDERYRPGQQKPGRP